MSKTSKTRSEEPAVEIPESTRFEDALTELESIVTQLESDEQSLEAAMQQFERGIKLVRFCQQSLGAAEQKIRILTEQNGSQQLKDFANGANGDPASEDG